MSKSIQERVERVTIMRLAIKYNFIKDKVKVIDKIPPGVWNPNDALSTKDFNYHSTFHMGKSKRIISFLKTGRMYLIE